MNINELTVKLNQIQITIDELAMEINEITMKMNELVFFQRIFVGVYATSAKQCGTDNSRS